MNGQLRGPAGKEDSLPGDLKVGQERRFALTICSYHKTLIPLCLGSFLLLKIPSQNTSPHFSKLQIQPYITSAWWLSWLEHCTVYQKVVSSIPGQDTYLGLIPSWGVFRRQLIDVLFSLSLPSPLPL